MSSTCLRRRTDSRSSRQAFTRAIHWPMMPSLAMGFFTQEAAALNEKLVVRKRAVNKVAIETRFAPTGLRAARNPSASSLPSRPPAGNAPRTSGTCTRVISAESESSSNPQPISFAVGASISWLRNQRIATKNIPIGNRNAP